MIRCTPYSAGLPLQRHYSARVEALGERVAARSAGRTQLKAAFDTDRTLNVLHIQQCWMGSLYGYRILSVSHKETPNPPGNSRESSRVLCSTAEG